MRQATARERTAARRRRASGDKKPWRYDWHNPEMHVITRPLYEIGFGMFEKRTEEYGPEEMTGLARESMVSSDNPSWRNDPSYNWAKKDKL